MLHLPTVMQLMQHSPSFFIVFVQFSLGHAIPVHLSSSGIRSNGIDKH